MAVDNYSFGGDSGPASDTIMEIDGASVRFEMGRGQSNVLNDVSLDIERNEILGVVGESGCGKSMFASALLNAVVDPGVISGSVKYYPGDGEATGAGANEPVDLVDLDDDELENIRWQQISMVFQGALESFNPTMRVREHFRETIHAHGEDEDERMDHARQVMEDLNLNPDHVLDSYPHELSGGMKQRALIALAVLLEPEMLVMDEPTAALDLLMQRSIISLLNDLQKEYDLTIVFITHDLPIIAGLVDRVGVMYAFEFVEVGQTENIIRNAAHPYTRALLRSVPSLDTPLEDMTTIEGDSPDPVNIPTGCSYAPRCPLADDRCSVEDPELLEVEDDHRVACFYWEEAEEELPYTVGTGIHGDHE